MTLNNSHHPLSPSPWQNALRVGIQSLKDVAIPGIILCIFAILLAFLYYYIPSVTSVFNKIGTWQQHYNPTFGILSMAFFGGLMPWLFRMIFPSLRPEQPVKELFFLIGLWTINGALINSLYYVQGIMFGTGNDVSTIIKKVLIDQLGFSLLISAPLNSVAYYWKDTHFSWTQLKASFKKNWYFNVVFPLYLVNISIWTPGVSVVYAMPMSLQIFMAGIINCFFSLICNFVTLRARKSAANSTEIKNLAL